MAAGLGTRLKPFTERQTKALIPVLGVPVAQFALDLASRSGVRSCVANVHHQAERAQAGLKALDLGGARLMISDESTQLLGSAGGYKKALSLLGQDTFFALNADVLCDVDLGALYRAHQRLRFRHGVSLTLAVFREAPAGEKYRRITVDPSSGLVTGLSMQPEEGPPFWAGVAVIEPEALSGVPDGPAEFIPTVLQPAVERRKVGAFVTSGHWYDVGSPELWLRAHLALIRGLEDGTLPGAWRRRIEKTSRRVAQEQWTSSRLRVAAPGWSGPCFWDGEGRAPESLGPESVLYGSAPRAALGRGIGLGGSWIDL